MKAATFAGKRALRIPCGEGTLVGILHQPELASARGLVIVTGGPQYRIGSHRQFALLADFLAARGTPVLRFDARGMGDSEGSPCGFENIHADIGAAIDTFFAQLPTLDEVVIWGLCDGASAAAFYAPSDTRVCGLALLNPWVRTSNGAARASLRHYYRQRLTEREFWRKLARGRFEAGAALASLARDLRDALTANAQETLPQRLYDGLSAFRGEVLLILSGDDLIAREFADLMVGSARWRKLSERFHHVRLPQANHTFARRCWRERVAQLTDEWLTSW